MTRNVEETGVAETTTTRRGFLGSAAGAAGSVGAIGATDGGRLRSSQNRITRRLVIPAADAFEDNYVGQFVFVNEVLDDPPEDVPMGECEFDDWSPAETRAYDGQLLDRRQEVPIAIDLTVYENGDPPRIEPASHFIIQNVVPCPDGYVGLEAEWVNRRALAGKAPGPTVTSTGTDGQPGFGVLATGAGFVAALVARAIARRRS